MSLFDKLLEVKDELLSSETVVNVIIDHMIDDDMMPRFTYRERSVVDMRFNCGSMTRYMNNYPEKYLINGFIINKDKKLIVAYSIKTNGLEILNLKINQFYVPQHSLQFMNELITGIDYTAYEKICEIIGNPQQCDLTFGQLLPQMTKSTMKSANSSA